MSKQAKKPPNLKGGLENIRPDIAAGRQPESSYIHKTEGPILNDKEKWVRAAYQKGLDLPAIISGSGLPVIAIYNLLNLDPADNRDKYDELCKLRQRIIFGSARQ